MKLSKEGNVRPLISSRLIPTQFRCLSKLQSYRVQLSVLKQISRKFSLRPRYNRYYQKRIFFEYSYQRSAREVPSLYLHLIHLLNVLLLPPCSWIPLQWRHNERNGVSNHQPHECLLNRLFRRRSKKPSKLRVTGLCAGNSPVTGEFPAQRASNAEYVSIWWRHHGRNLPEMFRDDVHTKPWSWLLFMLANVRTMMTSSNGNIFRVIGHLCGEFIGGRWISRTKTSDAKLFLMFSLICDWINGWVNNGEAGDLRRHRAHYDVSVMQVLFF